MTARSLMLGAAALAAAASLAAATSARVHGRPYPFGAPPGTTGGFGEPTCVACHFGNELNDPAGSLTIEGLPERYTPGQAYRLIIRLRRPRMAAAGFQLSARTAAGAQAGTLAVPQGTTAVKVEATAGIHYAGHTEPGSRLAAPGSAEWGVLWTAPATAASVTFSAAANAADDDRSPLGDYVYTAERASRMPSPRSAGSAHQLIFHTLMTTSQRPPVHLGDKVDVGPGKLCRLSHHQAVVRQTLWDTVDHD
jgi:hypothetical protein